MSGHTPSTQRVRERYVWTRDRDAQTEAIQGAAFDRWLTSVEAAAEERGAKVERERIAGDLLRAAGDYTPTTDDVREVWTEAQDITHDEGTDYHRAEFDRWLASHDESVRAAERERIARDIEAEAVVVDEHGNRGLWIEDALGIVREGAGA